MDIPAYATYTRPDLARRSTEPRLAIECNLRISLTPHAALGPTRASRETRVSLHLSFSPVERPNDLHGASRHGPPSSPSAAAPAVRKVGRHWRSFPSLLFSHTQTPLRFRRLVGASQTTVPTVASTAGRPTRRFTVQPSPSRLGRGRHTKALQTADGLLRFTGRPVTLHQPFSRRLRDTIHCSWNRSVHEQCTEVREIPLHATAHGGVQLQMEKEFQRLAEKLCKEKACRIQNCLQGKCVGTG